MPLSTNLSTNMCKTLLRKSVFIIFKFAVICAIAQCCFISKLKFPHKFNFYQHWSDLLLILKTIFELQICSISTNMCRKFAKISFCAVRVFIRYFCCCLFFANSFNLLILLKNKMLENDIKRVTNSTKKYFLNLPHNPKVVGSNPTPATKGNLS